MNKTHASQAIGRQTRLLNLLNDAQLILKHFFARLEYYAILDFPLIPVCLATCWQNYCEWICKFDMLDNSGAVLTFS